MPSEVHGTPESPVESWGEKEGGRGGGGEGRGKKEGGRRKGGCTCTYYVNSIGFNRIQHLQFS